MTESPERSTSSIAARSISGSREQRSNSRRPAALVIDLRRQLLYLVIVKRQLRGQPEPRLATVRHRGAMPGVDVAGNPEQPCARRALTGVEGLKRLDRLKKRL